MRTKAIRGEAASGLKRLFLLVSTILLLGASNRT